MKKLVKAVLIYDNDNQASIYARNYYNDIAVTADLLSGFLSVAECLNKNKDLIGGAPIDQIPMEQFTVNVNGKFVEFKDSNGVHNNVYLHSNERYGGVVSIDDSVDYHFSKEIFNTLVREIDKCHVTSIGLKKKTISSLNNILDDFQKIIINR